MQAAHLTWRELETTAPHWMHEELFTILSVVDFWLATSFWYFLVKTVGTTRAFRHDLITKAEIGPEVFFSKLWVR